MSHAAIFAIGLILGVLWSRRRIGELEHLLGCVCAHRKSYMTQLMCIDDVPEPAECSSVYEEPEMVRVN